MADKIYVGTKPDHSREVFRSATKPTDESHGKTYLSVTGPFRTVRGAQFMALYQDGSNPHLLTVADAERAAKRDGKSQAQNYARYRALKEGLKAA